MKRAGQSVGGEDGFTLLETLIALAILGIALGMAVQSVATATGRLVQTQQTSSLENAARRILATKVEGVTTPQEKTGKDGETGYAWRLRLEPVRLPGGGDQQSATEVTLTVETGGVRGQRAVFRTIAVGAQAQEEDKKE